VISPVLANLFLHYAFDAWIAREFPGVLFERYADDAVVHCSSSLMLGRCCPGWTRTPLTTPTHHSILQFESASALPPSPRGLGRAKPS
jgi:hypothetical protein